MTPDHKAVFPNCNIATTPSDLVLVETSCGDTAMINATEGLINLQFTCPAFRDEVFESLGHQGERLDYSNRWALLVEPSNYPSKS